MKRNIKLWGIIILGLLLMCACRTSRKTTVTTTADSRTATTVVRSVTASGDMASESKATTADTTMISSGVSTRIDIGRDSLGRPNLFLINSTGNLQQTGVSAFNLKEGITGTKSGYSETGICTDTETTEETESCRPPDPGRSAMAPLLVAAFILLAMWIIDKANPKK